MKILTRDDTDHNTEYVTREDAEHEMEGWKNKWECAVDMAARAQLDAASYRAKLEGAKAAVNTLVRENERLRDLRAKCENDAAREALEVALLHQDFDVIRRIITKGGTAADILKFLDTPNA
jgi:hypothetical protein